MINKKVLVETRKGELLFFTPGPRTAWASQGFIILHPSVMRGRKADVRERKRGRKRTEEGEIKERGV